MIDCGKNYKHLNENPLKKVNMWIINIPDYAEYFIPILVIGTKSHREYLRMLPN